jgi:hypothetical protein
MATVANQPGIDEDKDKEGVNLGAPAPTIGGGTAPSGGGVSSAAASTPGAITGGQKAATSSGSYSDVGRYLKANKPRIGQYANQIAGKVSDRVNEADIATQEEVSGIQGDIDAAKLPGTDFYKGKDVTNLDVGKSQELLSGGWKGPSAEDVALSTLSELEGARDLANLSGSYTGSKELIDQTMQPSDGRYTRGMTSLGAASLRGDTKARGILAQSREAAESAYTRGVESENTLRDNVEQGIEDNIQAGENFADWLRSTTADISDNPAQAQAARDQALLDRLASERDNIGDIFLENKDDVTQRQWDLKNQIIINYMDDIKREWREGKGPYAGLSYSELYDAALPKAREHAARVTMENSGISNKLSGLTSDDVGRLNAIISILAGSGRNDIAESVNSALSQGTYNQKSVEDQLIEWLSGGPKAEYQYANTGGTLYR